MSGYDIGVLKTEQDQMNARKAKLLNEFLPFRSRLVEWLNRFVQDAEAIGLQGVKACKIEKDTEEYFEVTFMLNEAPLLLVSTNGVYFLDKSKVLSAMMRIYTQGYEDAPPQIIVAVHESIMSDGTTKYTYDVTWLSVQGPQLIRSNGHLGKTVAGDLIGHFYSLSTSWNEGPSLRAIRGGHDKGGPGFIRALN